jgi:hypothetical protein
MKYTGSALAYKAIFVPKAYRGFQLLLWLAARVEKKNTSQRLLVMQHV